MIVNGNILTPSDGFKYISNGCVWSDRVYLGTADSVENWHDTNEEPIKDEFIENAVISE